MDEATSDERSVEEALCRDQTRRNAPPRSSSTLSARLSGALRRWMGEKIPVAVMMLIVVCVTVAFRGDEEKTRSMIEALTRTPFLQIGGIAASSFTRNSTTNGTT
jgi:CRISPR/Cas system CMR subunit Cmr4 (Cas7 group RAMP superfamily)